VVAACIAFAVGALTGILSGMGIGGGTLLVLYLTAVTNTAASAAAGINLLYFLGCAPASLWFHIRQHRVCASVAFPAILSGMAAALITAMLAPADSPPWLRRAFGILLLTVGIRELWMLWRTRHGETNNG